MKRHAPTATAVLLAFAALACGDGESPDQQGSQDQQQPPAAQQQQQQEEEIDVSDEELEAFAEATDQLQDVAEDARSDMQGAEGQDEAEQVREDFQKQQAKIVEDAGLDTARYTEIRNAIETNPDLRNRFLELRQQDEQ
ncbi:MAG: DUF4168 domain-containing protein [Gemmatimonadota bacterium]